MRVITSKALCILWHLVEVGSHHQRPLERRIWTPTGHIRHCLVSVAETRRSKHTTMQFHIKLPQPSLLWCLMNRKQAWSLTALITVSRTIHSPISDCSCNLDYCCFMKYRDNVGDFGYISYVCLFDYIFNYQFAYRKFKVTEFLKEEVKIKSAEWMPH